MKLIEKLSQKGFILSLSSGFFGFFAHLGFAKAVLSEGLSPKLITGASAGAIVGACLGSGMSLQDMEEKFLALEKKHYWDPGIGLGLLRGGAFEKTLREYLQPDMTQTKWPLSISTFNVNKRKTEIFKSGDLPLIVRASCALPLFFQPVKIGTQFYVDGGIADKMGWSEINDSDLVLGHALRTHKWIDRFEQKNWDSYRNRHILRVNNIPSTGPGNFGNGPHAINLVYEQTKKFLDRELTS